MTDPLRWCYFAVLRWRNARRRRTERFPDELAAWQKGERIPLKGAEWEVGDLRPPTKDFPRSVIILAHAAPTRRALKTKLARLRRYVPKGALRALDASRKV